MDKKTDNSKNNSTTKKLSGRRNHFIRGNTVKQHQETRSNQGIEERRWSILEKRWDCLHRQQDLYAK